MENGEKVIEIEGNKEGRGGESEVSQNEHQEIGM
jgi:hypothetical protein